MIPLPPTPVIVICLAIVAALKSSKGGMTPERQVVFEEAMNDWMDPVRIRKLAGTFDEQGLKEPYGDMLRKRAALRELPAETKKARREVFREMMKSTDVPRIEKVADAFFEQGCTGVAGQLREYAKGLKAQPKAEAEIPEVKAEVVHEQRTA